MKRDENLGGKGGRAGITGANAFDVCFGGPFKGYI